MPAGPLACQRTGDGAAPRRASGCPCAQQPHTNRSPGAPTDDVRAPPPPSRPQQFLFLKQKCRSLYNQRKRPAKIAWTTLYRKAHRKASSAA